MTVADLKIEGIADYQRIADIEIFEEANNHGVCKLSLMMKTDFKASEVINWAQKQITLKGKVGNSEKIIFCGVATDYGVENHAETVLLLVRVKTLSSKLAVSKKSSCTFQKASKKYSDIFNEIKKNYEGADFTAAGDKELPELIYRNNLTDWEFLLELAESHGQILFSDSKSDRLRVTLGFKAFKEFDGKDFKVVRQNLPLDFCHRLEKNTYSTARPSYFLETEFFTYDPEIGVGHGVKFDNQVQAVVSSHIFLRDNILCNEIKIRHKEGCKAEEREVTKFFDRFYYLTGKVLEVTGEDDKKTDLKIQFDCDQEQNKDDAIAIPYESVVGNYLYSMPDENDKVFVYTDRNQPSAMGCLRANEVDDKPENKSFKTKDAALTIDPKKLAFTAATDKAELVEEDGIKINAKKDIVFSASGDIYIQAAAGGLPDDQIQFAVTHSTQYLVYTAAMGQPAPVQINPSGSIVGKVQAQFTNVGAKKEDVELSDLAKELDQITKRQSKNPEQQNAGGGSGGSVKFDSTEEIIFNVQNSFVTLKDGEPSIKTRVFNILGYIPVAGGGTGSGGIGSGNPNPRNEETKLQQGQQDRPRIKLNMKRTGDNKNISLSAGD